MLEKPIFPYDSEFISDDDSNFLEDYAVALSADQSYYQDLVTSASVALLQVMPSAYLFVISGDEKLDILSVNINGKETVVKKLTSFEKLK